MISYIEVIFKHIDKLRARFTKQGKLALECISIKALMGKILQGDLLTMHIKEHRRSQIISIMTRNDQEHRKLLLSLTYAFLSVNNNNLMSANVSKLHCVINFNTLR